MSVVAINAIEIARALNQLSQEYEKAQARIRELEASLELADRHAETVEFGYCDAPHKLGDTAPDGKALLQIPHEQNQGCENWKPVQVRHRELWQRIQKAREILEGYLRDATVPWPPLKQAIEALEGR